MLLRSPTTLRQQEKKILTGMGGKSYRRKKAEGVSGASNRKPSVGEKDKF